MPDAEEPLEADLNLLQRVAAGDRAAAAAFVNRHQAAVFRHAQYLTATREDAEDTFQETFLAALKQAGGFRGEASAKTWLFTIARNAALRRARRPKVPTVEMETLEALAERAGWGAEDPERLARAAQDRERLAGALRQLAPEEREVVLLRDREGWSGEEVARALEISIPAMKSRLHRARMRLAGLLREEGQACGKR